MDATITNLSTERVFIPGPQLDMAPTGDPDGGDVKVWPEVTVSDIDGNSRIKELVVAGTISVAMDVDSYDAAEAPANGAVAFVTNGRKAAEGAGLGTGVPAYFDAATPGWLNMRDDTPVLA